MKLIKILSILIALIIPITVYGEDPKIQADILMGKITSLLKADEPAKALPYMAELEELGPSLPNRLPESFYFYYIDTLVRAGQNDEALIRARSYLGKYGKKGSYYAKVIKLMTPLQMQADELAARNAKAAKEARQQQVKEAERQQLAAIEAQRVASEREAARIAAEQQNIYNRKQSGAVHDFSEQSNRNFIAGLISAPFLPLYTLSDLSDGKGLFAYTDPAVYGNPDSMLAKATRLQDSRDQAAVLVATR